MPPSVTTVVRRAIQRGDVSRDTFLSSVFKVGPYLSSRFEEATRKQNPTVDDLVRKVRRMTDASLVKFLYRALQNRRGNQCVSKRTAGTEHRQTYHVGDVNEHAYEAIAEVLNSFAGRQLPRRLPRRSPASRECGCKRVCDGSCKRARDGACIPRNSQHRGFVGVPSLPGQREIARTDAERRSVRRRAYTRPSPSLNRDPDSRVDVRGGHARTLRYSDDGIRMWRRPGPRVRLPAWP